MDSDLDALAFDHGTREPLRHLIDRLTIEVTVCVGLPPELKRVEIIVLGHHGVRASTDGGFDGGGGVGEAALAGLEEAGFGGEVSGFSEGGVGLAMEVVLEGDLAPESHEVEGVVAGVVGVDDAAVE